MNNEKKSCKTCKYGTKPPCDDMVDDCTNRGGWEPIMSATEAIKLLKSHNPIINYNKNTQYMSLEGCFNVRAAWEIAALLELQEEQLKQMREQIGVLKPNIQ